MVCSPPQSPRILSWSLVFILLAWIERQGNLPWVGASLRAFFYRGDFIPDRLMAGSLENPWIPDVFLLALTALLFAVEVALVRRKPFRAWIAPTLFGTILIIPLLFWVPTGASLWNLTGASLGISIPSLLIAFAGFALFWGGLAYFAFHPARRRFSAARIRGAYLALSILTPFLSADRLAWSLLVAAYLPSIIQQLPSPPERN